MSLLFLCNFGKKLDSPEEITSLNFLTVFPVFYKELLFSLDGVRHYDKFSGTNYDLVPFFLF